ncbi:hypothetical protein [Clostridium sp. 'White wine YQ']|uniref:hypothetical protein n=1 Tax=Clostridium sp. 'White wine YQ' TaxID=3027474 RepID=UPI002366A532|nr:hypothetical protein [Clostridium sp. 'White wine YQ']MDD7794077.1 hypothetical protein [Clostridium sp. 'White wine YQ']
MPVSKKRKKVCKKKQDYNKNKINKVIKTYSKLIDNYLPLMKDHEIPKESSYEISVVSELGSLSLSSTHFAAVIKPIKNNNEIIQETKESIIRERLILMLAIHVMIDILPEEIEENKFTDKLKYYYGLIAVYYDLEKIPSLKNYGNITFNIKEEYLDK